jgi:hypothetical protein
MATLIGLTVLIIVGCIIAGAAIAMLICDADYTPAWVAGVIVGLGCFVYGICGLVAVIPSNEKQIEVEVQHPSINEEYNYCPYCGKEIE